MSRIVVIGSGGHAREILGVLLEAQSAGQPIEPLGFVDENPETHGQMIDGLPVLGDFSWFRRVDTSRIEVVCALGAPPVCRRLALRVQEMGLRFASAISPRACISPRAQLGRSIVVFPNVIVNTGASIGDFVTLNVAVTVSHDASVGDFTNVNPGVHLAGRVTIGEGCYLGMGSNVIQGITVGAWSIIGAGAVVIRDLPPAVTAVGVPARVIKVREREEGAHERYASSPR